LQGMFYAPGAFTPRSSLINQRKLEVFLSGRPNNEVVSQGHLNVTKIILTQGRKPTKTGYSLGKATLLGGLRTQQFFQLL
jgi:hypothetical protein